MQVSVEVIEGLERRMTVELPSDQIESEVNKRLNDAKSKVNINGFRRGKVPLSVVRQRFGAGVRQEVMGEVINRSYSEALESENLRPAGMPSIEPVDLESDTIKYIATFEVYPEVSLGDFSELSVERVNAEVVDADIDEMIETLRKQNSDWNTVESAAADDNTVVIDFAGTVDGEEFEGGSAEGQSLVLGSNTMVPGFEDGIIGMTAGEEKSIDVTFPEDYQAENLQGKAAVFKVSVKEVKERELPEVDAEFAKRFGIENYEEATFRDEVRANMTRELDTRLQSQLKGAALEAVSEANELAVPSSMVKEEVKRLKGEMFQQFGGDVNIDLDQFPDEPFIEQAEKRVKLGLLVSEIVSSAELKVDADKVKAEIQKIASSYESPEEVEQYYYSNEEMLNNLQMKVLEDQVVEHVLASAQTTDVSKAYQDVMSQQG